MDTMTFRITQNPDKSYRVNLSGNQIRDGEDVLFETHRDISSLAELDETLAELRNCFSEVQTDI